MKQARKPIVSRGRVAVLAVLACGAFLGSGAPSAHAALPNTLNTGSGCPSQTDWLVTCTTGGQTGDGANIMRVTVWASHDNDKFLASLLTDDDWDGNSFDTRGVSIQRPTIDGGYPRSRANLTWNHDTGGTGMSCTLGFGTRATSDRVLRMQARDDDGQTESGTTDSMVRFVGNNGCSGPEDYPFLFNISSGNFGDQVTPGSNVTVTYNGDDPDSGSNEDFEGVRWRLRNLRTGAVSGETTDCDSNGDNNTKSTTANIPDRGAWVIEAELRNANDCSQNDRNDWWWALGTVDANSSAAPGLDLDSATTTVGGVVRPQFGQDWTVRAQDLVDPNAAEGGGSQILEWDLNNNTGDGVNGYEETNFSGYGDILDVGDNSGTDATQRNVDSSGQAAGLYSVRARVTDNGAADAADTIRRRSGNVTLQYRVDAAPTANNQTVTTDTNATNVPITLTGSDPDGDSLDYTVTDGPDHGTVSGGTGASRTYTPTPGYAGTDSFTFEVDDGFGRTDTAVVSINVRPNTTITDQPALLSNDTTPTFEFNSNGSPVTFQCKLDTGAFTTCTSPHTYPTLAEGEHTFQVRAVATNGSIVDPSPDTYTWSIDATPPVVTLDTFPNDPTNQTTASFAFHANEPVSGFECEIDGGGFDPCISGVSYPGLAEGSHTFKVKATDEHGNESATVTHTWFVDLTAPTAQIDVFPPALNNSTMADFEFSGTDNHSAPGSLDFQCRLDGAATFTPCTSPQSYSGLSQGSHTFRVQAIDEAGNTGPEDTHTWTVDTIAPNTAINDDFDPAPPGCSVNPSPPPPNTCNPNLRTTSQDATFDFFANDVNATFECRLDNDPGGFTTCTTQVNYSGLTDGPHKFEVRARDQAGNVDTTPATWEWSVHSGLPDTILDVFPANPSNSPNAHFEFHGTIPDSTFVCEIDGNVVDPCTSPQDYPGLSEGQHTFTVTATDEFMRVDPTPTTYTWEIDLTAPDTEIVDKPVDPSNSDSASFTFTSTESNSTFQCQLDSGPWEPCDDDLPQEYTGLSEGSHTFQVKATDQAGNEDPTPDSYTWTVDTVAPTTTIDAKPDDPSRLVDPSFEFSSDEDPNVEFFCRLDSDPFTSCTSGHQVTNLGQGSHTFEVYAVDEAGNVGDPASYTWHVDLTPPETSITANPPALDDTTSATFEFEGTDDHSDSGDLTFQCRLNSTEETDFQPCLSGDTFTAVEGTNTFEVRALDEAGNWDPSPASYEWTVDVTGPTATIDDPKPADPTNDDGAVFNFSGNDNHSAPGDLAFECELDGGGFDPCASGTEFGPVGEGSHTFNVRAIDEAGNTGPEASHTWFVDLTAPTAQIDNPTPADPTSSDAAVFNFSGNDNHSAPGDLTFSCELNGNVIAPCTSGTDFGPAVEGTNTFKVTATDEAGNTSPEASYTWEVDQTAPTASIDSGPADPTNSTAANFAFTVGGSPTAVECDLDGGGFVPCDSNSAHAYAGLAQGGHAFTVKVTDAAGNSSTAEHTWTVDTTEPDTSITDQPANPTNSTAAVFEFGGTDNHSDPSDLSFECQLDGSGFAPCSSGDDFGPLGEGSHTFEVRAIDEATNTDGTPDSHTWVVDTTPPGVTVDTGPPDPTNVDTATIEFTVTGSPAMVECSLDGGAFTPCTSPHNLTGVPDGDHTVVVKVTDAAGNEGTDDWTWTSDTGVPETSITAAPVNPTSVNSATFGFTADEPSTFECSLDGSGFVPCASGQGYTGLASGNHSFSVRATDTAANTDPTPATHAWTISSAQGGVAGAGGGLAPLIERRIRALNVPMDGVFQIASVTCRAGTCSLTEKTAVIKVGNKKFVGTVEIAMVTKQLAAVDTFKTGETAQVIVHFAPGVKHALAANNVGSLTVRLTARTDAGGGASDSKKIKLKAKWLKKLLG